MQTLCLLLTLTKLSGILQDTGYFHGTPDTYIVHTTASQYFQSVFLNLTQTFFLVVKSLSTLLEEYPKIYRAP